MSISDTRTQLREILQREGIRPALIFLNSLGSHRFTALYRFDSDMLTNLYFVDRENPLVDSSAEIPVMASYCVFVRDSGARFLVEDSIRDERVVGHPKRQAIQSYCGVPLLDEQGKMFGTICHFDLDPVTISSTDVELMEVVAEMLRSHDRPIPGP